MRDEWAVVGGHAPAHGVAAALQDCMRIMASIEQGHRDGFIENDGIRLHYVDWGEAKARPMVLLHGLGDCARSWDPFASELSADYRVIGLDLRGHGDSRWAAPGAYRLEQFVSDVEALVDQVGLTGMVLVGHSEGGQIAISYTTAHPAMVDTLIALDCGLDAPDPTGQGVSSPTWRRWEERFSLEEVVQHLREGQPGSAHDALALQALHLTNELPGGRWTWKGDPAALRPLLEADLWRDWRMLRCPVLLARGRQSRVLAHAAAVRMQEGAPRVRLAELEGGGHWFHLELPSTLEATVRWFLQAPPP